VVELPRARLLVINATCCQPPINKTDAMMRRAVQCCRPALLHQLAAIDPATPTLAMGKWAAYALTEKDKGMMSGRGFVRRDFRLPQAQTRTIEEAHYVIGSGLKARGIRHEAVALPRVRKGGGDLGSVRRSAPQSLAGRSIPGALRTELGASVGGLIVTWHPTFAAFYNPYEWGVFCLDVDRFARMIRGELRPGPVRLITEPTPEDVRRLLKDSRGALALDIETAPQLPEKPWTGKDPLRAKLKTVGLGCEEWGLSYWWGAKKGVMERVLKDVLEDESVTKVLMNGWWFDLPVLKRYGIQVR
jgi:hypothetical protein